MSWLFLHLLNRSELGMVKQGEVYVQFTPR